MKSVPLTAMVLTALDRHSPADAQKFREQPDWATMHKIGIRLGGDLGAACSAYAGALQVLPELATPERAATYERCVTRAVELLGGLSASPICAGWIIVCPDGHVRHYPYHNFEDADEDTAVAAKDCRLGYEEQSPLELSLPTCPGGPHVVRPIVMSHALRPHA